MTLVELSKVCEFLDYQANFYTDGYECEEYDTKQLKKDLIDFLDHPENWVMRTASSGQEYYEKLRGEK